MNIRKSFELRLRNAWRVDESTLEISMPPFWIKIQIRGPASSRGRRTILLLIFRKLRELWDNFREVELYHVTRGFLWTALPPKPISFRETPDLNSQVKRVGYALRFRRHRNRLTLREVSELSGVNIGHISDIERGKHRPSRHTLSRIEAGLARFEEEGVVALHGSRTILPKDFRKSASDAKKKRMHGPGDHFYDSLAQMYEAQQRLGASIVDSDPSPKA